LGALIQRDLQTERQNPFNADNRNDPERPCHSQLLKRDILIVENLTNLSQLPNTGFRFFAVPIKAKATAAMTIRAFAEIE